MMRCYQLDALNLVPYGQIITLVFAMTIFLTHPILAQWRHDTLVDSTGRPPAAPQYTAQQDSAYHRALQLRLPPDLRFQLDVLALQSYWLQYQQQQQRSLAAIIRQNLQIPDTAWLPTAPEMVQYQYHLAQAQFIPTVTMQQNPALRGVQIPLQAIAAFLGIGEDRSPEISFRLRGYAEVEIVVYSPQAKKIATIFRGTRAPGKYTIRWNGRTDQGYPVPPGEYVLEVRVRGNRDRFIQRKLIQWEASMKGSR